jgi:hypothetical protein
LVLHAFVLDDPSKERLFTAVGEGDVALAGAMSPPEALAGARALSCRKLFDGRAVHSRHDRR